MKILIIIVPTIRAVSFLKESIKKVIDKPIVSPNILSISEFVTDLSRAKYYVEN